MSGFKKDLINRRNDKLEEERVRLKRIQNQNKADMISEAFWRMSQAELYPNSFPINIGSPSLQEVLITQQKNDVDDITNRQTAVSYLGPISDPEYRLSPQEVSALLQSFDKIKKNIRKDYPKGITKDEFVQYIKLKGTTDYLNPAEMPADYIDEPRKNQMAVEKAKAFKANVLAELPKRDTINELSSDTLGFSKMSKKLLSRSTGELLNIANFKGSKNPLPRAASNAEEPTFAAAYAEPAVIPERNPMTPVKAKRLRDEVEQYHYDYTKKLSKEELINKIREDSQLSEDERGRILSNNKVEDISNSLLNELYIKSGKNRYDKTPTKASQSFEMSPSKKAKENTKDLHKESTEMVRNIVNADYNLSSPIKKLILYDDTGKKRAKQDVIKNYRDQLKIVYGNEKEGGRLRKKLKKRKVKGGALVRFARKQETDEFQLPNTKLRIDGGKLRNNNILKLKYKCNNNVHPNMKIQRISQNLSDILYDIIKGKYDPRFYKLLNPMEKELVKDFIRICKYEIDVDPDETEDFNKNYEILCSQIMSGNDNKDIKAKLKEYTLFGMKTRRLHKADAMATLVALT